MHDIEPLPTDYAIAATASLQERRPRTLKHGDTFALFDPNGDIIPGPGSVEGLFHADTRYLSAMALLIEGVRPMLLSSTMRDDNATLTCDLTNPDVTDATGQPLDHDMIHVRRTKFVFAASCFERIAIRNYAAVPIRLRVALRFAADFADLFEVRGAVRPFRGRTEMPSVGTDRVDLGYVGLDRRRRTTTVRFDPVPETIGADRVGYTVDLKPGARHVLHVEVRCDDATDVVARPRDAFYDAIRAARRSLRASAARATAIISSNDIFNESVRRSVSDFYMLVTDTEQGAYPYAGIPWFSTAFGRDALVAAMETLWMDPSIARGVLGFLAANQADRVDPVADAEPGKILHEVRRGEMAELGEVPFRRYYGSVDSTPLFVMLAGAYLERTGDTDTMRALWPAISRALDWIDRYGDRDRDGFVEYDRQTEKGLANQGWKDSFDSVFHADGTAAVGPIALVEVQGYVFAAKQAGAIIARALGDADAADRFSQDASEMRARIEARFWLPDIGTYALALDGTKRPCAVQASNAGHLLLAGVPALERAVAVAETLLGRSFYSGWGVRTVAVGEARYNPMSYHNGSVWPHDNALIGMGMARYGLRREAARVLEGLFDACAYIDLRRLPELLCGFPRRRGEGPTFYPVACAPQAWSAAAMLGLLQACLGIGFDPATRTVRFDRPVMPRFVNEILLYGLTLGGASIDVALRGNGNQVSMTVLARRGDVRATLTA